MHRRGLLDPKPATRIEQACATVTRGQPLHWPLTALRPGEVRSASCCSAFRVTSSAPRARVERGSSSLSSALLRVYFGTPWAWMPMQRYPAAVQVEFNLRRLQPKGLVPPENQMRSRLSEADLARRQAQWDYVETALEEMFSFVVWSSENNGFADSVSADLSLMTIEFGTFCLDDGHSYTDTRHLWRYADGQWLSRPWHISSDPPEFRRSAVQDVVHFFKWDDSALTLSRLADLRASLVETQERHLVEAPYVAVLEDRYQNCIRFLERHPGVYPGISERAFIEGLYDPDRRWEFPRHL